MKAKIKIPPKILILFFTIIPAVLFSQLTKYTSSNNGMVATAHPIASNVAVEMLKKGGNAIDAAVAAAFVIGVVEPDGSGIGGGGAMIIYIKDKRKSYYINYYAQAGENIEKQKYKSEIDRHTGKSILIPGTIAGLVLAHEKFGKLSLKEIIAPAIKYAEEGFKIDLTLATIILDNSEVLSDDSVTASIYLEDGFPKMEGDLIIQKSLARTLRIISEKGHKGFYEGELVTKMTEGIKKRGGILTKKDFANYKAKISEPVFGTYRGYNIISTNAPQSGITLIEGLNILENHDLKKAGHFSISVETAHLIAETERRIYADRFSYIGDPNFETIPVSGLISKKFAKIRYDNINLYKPEPINYKSTPSGNPFIYNSSKDRKKNINSKIYNFGDEDDDGKFNNSTLGEDYFDSWGNRSTNVKASRDSIKIEQNEDNDDEQEFDGGHTTHLSVVDKNGNAVALTQTLGTFFGSAQTVEGVLFNCARANFSSSKGSINSPKNNKQPRSSITPTIILKDDNPFLVIGTPGGSRIITTLLETIVNIIDFDMNAEQANDTARIYCQKYVDFLHLESGIKPNVVGKLKRMGHIVQVHDGIDLFFGGVHMVYIDPKTGIMYGSADKRRGGSVVGIKK